ncbi:hypothetical protein [Amycolatopsis decaplanina]|uniref:Epoxide hydrolase n=1 Tax=Amycolatopsis decaplanina DSM 44594 TaxID=1284240 RepID=M2WTY5_9PSEU|nr:hypothetical protein [Amycolatopsis decaplanina]EME52226.1 epoxide hydrolase [Amycolatopsis decaplanina DSM 44594]
MSTELARLVPERVEGLHLTMRSASPLPEDRTAPSPANHGCLADRHRCFECPLVLGGDALGAARRGGGERPAGDRGGHFPGLEQPDPLVSEIREAFRDLPQNG